VAKATGPKEFMTIEHDNRLIREHGLEARIAALTFPVLDQLGFRLVRVRVTGEKGCTVQIMAERPDGSFTIDDCEALSHALSPVLDAEDVIDKAYHLEISSPGIDRPLVRREDFSGWSGFQARLETDHMIEGRRKFKGQLGPVENDHVTLRAQDKDGEHVYSIPLEALREARLILTDDLIEASLKKQPGQRH
jgi:ribosome maturation factor RimP